MAYVLLFNLLPLLAIYGLFKLLLFKLEHWSSLTGINPTDVGPERPDVLKQVLSTWSNLLDVLLVILLMALVYFELIFSVSAVVSLFMSIFLVAHRLFWPIVLRVLDACKRNKIVSEGRVLLMAGGLLIFLGIGKFGPLQSIFLKIFG